MPNEHFNQLSPAEHERLALLMEECAEVIQIVGKIMRHGYESCHPDGGPTNRQLLEKELGHVYAAMGMMKDSADIIMLPIREHAAEKRLKVRQYLHHQEAPDAR